MEAAVSLVVVDVVEACWLVCFDFLEGLPNMSSPRTAASSSSSEEDIVSIALGVVRGVCELFEIAKKGLQKSGEQTTNGLEILEKKVEIL